MKTFKRCMENNNGQTRLGFSHSLNHFYRYLYAWFCGLLVFSITLQHASGSEGGTGSDGLTVSNASYQPRINGLYYRCSAYCNGYMVYEQNVPADPHFIYVTGEWLDNGSYIYYWAIGTTICAVKDKSRALNKVTGYIMKPCDATSPWFELSPTLGVFVENPSLSVEQYDSGDTSTSTQEIVTFTIVAFVLTLALFIVLIIIVKRIGGDKQQHRQEEYMNRPENIDRIEMRRREREARREQLAPYPPSHGDNPAFSITVEPPAYDNQPPPSYDVVEREKLAEEEQNRDLPSYHSLNVSLIDNQFPSDNATVGCQEVGVVTELSVGVASLPSYQLECEEASTISQGANSNTVEATPVGVVCLSSTQTDRAEALPV